MSVKEMALPDKDRSSLPTAGIGRAIPSFLGGAGCPKDTWFEQLVQGLPQVGQPPVHPGSRFGLPSLLQQSITFGARHKLIRQFTAGFGLLVPTFFQTPTVAPHHGGTKLHFPKTLGLTLTTNRFRVFSTANQNDLGIV